MRILFLIAALVLAGCGLARGDEPVYDQSLPCVSGVAAVKHESGKWWAYNTAGKKVWTIPPVEAVTAGGDAIVRANQKRAERGLPPFIRDEGLTQAAIACAQHRAANRIQGHSANDFDFVRGTGCSAAGCACWANDGDFGSCCLYEGYTYAGAATIIGPDGMAYHHLYVR